MTDILCHCEGHSKGIASNHSDVMHWFPKFGKSMDTFRNDVNAKVNEGTVPQPNVTPNNKIDVKYQVYVSKWLPDVINTTDYAGIYGKPITGLRANTVGSENTAGKLIYRVHTKNGKWLGEITDREKDKSGDNFAGILSKQIDGVMIKGTKVKAKYRVHLINGGWLPWVDGYNENDAVYGYAGKLGQAIDGIQIEVL